MKEVYTNIYLREVLFDHEVEKVVGVTSDKKIFIKVRILSYFESSGLFVVPFCKKCHSPLRNSFSMIVLCCVSSPVCYVSTASKFPRPAPSIILSNCSELDFSPPLSYAMNLCVSECFGSRICIRPYNLPNRWC